MDIQMHLPTTPEGKKIEKILRNRSWQEPSKAGQLAAKLAQEVFFGDKVLAASSLTGDRGRLDVLDPDKMDEIEDIIIHLYRKKVKEGKLRALWEGCRKAIGKKCQNVRNKYQPKQQQQKQTSK